MATAFPDECYIFTPQDHEYELKEESGQSQENFQMIENFFNPESSQYFNLDDASEELRLLLEILNIKKWKTIDFKIATAIQKLHIGEMKEEISVSDIPKILLNNLNLLKFKSRTLSNSQQLMFSGNKVQSPLEFDYLELMQGEKEANFGSVHPMDIFLLIFFSCDKLYRQKFTIKVAKCQLSLPLVAFDPFSQKLTIYSFSFQKLFKECFLNKKKQFEFPIVDQLTHTVSAIRIGNVGMEKSKSKLLNDLLDVSHDYFFHRDCEGSVPTNYLLNQTIEIGWYLPSGKDDHFDEPITYLNLRGDATHLERQLTLLTLVSNVMLIFISPPHLNENNIQVLEGMFEQIYLRSDPEQIPYLILIVESLDKRYDLRKLKNYIPNQSNLIKLGKNEADNISRIINGIRTGKNKSVKKYCINDITDQALKIQIVSEDANEGEFQKNSDEIQFLINHELPEDPSQVNLGVLKNNMLQLQGDSWKKIAENFRSYYRTNEENRVDQYIIREEQLNCLITNPSDSIQCILSKVKDNTFKNFEIFWRIFQNELDKLAKSHIPKLYEKYKEERDIMFKGSRTNPRLNQDILNRKLEIISQDISNSSFGIEHVFREFGQIYEVCMYFWETDYNKKVKSLEIDPNDLIMMASQLLLSGVQLEILDGDVSHIPIKWISDILIQVSVLIGPSKRFYIISVLGLQSSGKSTLLNTMFGLDFAVSAGKCTKGAFMHLITIEKETSKHLGYDYLLIIDTEGLRAPELTAQESYLHDNEIATFAIGLADLTIINILGEHSTEMQDILQITIYALIRMRQANCYPKCVFVHQNAAAINMENKLAIITRKFVQLLDEITLTAAKKEKVSERFQTFNNVIEFNPQEDIFYFPTLFRGDPPMAPINPGYCESADKLRQFLISNSLKFSHSYLTLQNIALKIKDLWNSVMEEDFVFNYRNVQELNALHELDYAQTQWTALFTQQLSEWVNKMATNIRSKEGDDLEMIWEQICIQLRDRKDQMCIEEQNNIKVSFFRNQSRKEFLSARELISDEFFISYRENEYNYSLSSLGEIYNKQKSLRPLQRMFNEAEDKLLKNIQEELERGKKEFVKLNNAEINNIFNNKWTELTQDIPKQKRKGSVNIRNELKKLLINSPLLHDVTRGEKEVMLEDFTRYIEFCTLNPFTLDAKYIHVNQLSSSKKHTDEDSGKNEVLIIDNREILAYNKLNCIIEHVKQECDELVERKCSNNMYFSISYFEWIIEIVKNICVDQCDSCDLLLPNQFINDLIFYECCKRVTYFERLQEKYIQSVSVNEMVEGKKPVYKNYFIISWMGIADEIIVGLDLSTILFKEIKDLVCGNQKKRMLDYFRNLNRNYSSKFEIQVAVLMDLCKKEQINEYILYINNPTEYIKFWLLDRIRYFYYNNDNRKSIMSDFKTEVKSLIDYSVESAIAAIDSIQCKNEFSASEVQEEWKTRFAENILRKINFPGINESNIFDRHTISDYDRFITAFKDNLGNFELEFEPLAHCIEIKDQIFRKYIRCTKTCKFCNEMCMRNTIKHIHSCDNFHRPHCLKSKSLKKFERRVITTQIIIEENPNKTNSDGILLMDTEGGDLGQEDEDFENNLQANLQNWNQNDVNPNLISESQMLGNAADKILFNKSDYQDCPTKVLKGEKFSNEEDCSTANYKYFAPDWEIRPKDSKNPIYWKWVVSNFHQELFLPDIKLSQRELRSWQYITKDQVLSELEELLVRYHNCSRWANVDNPASNIVSAALARMFYKLFPFLRRRSC